MAEGQQRTGVCQQAALAIQESGLAGVPIESTVVRFGALTRPTRMFTLNYPSGRLLVGRVYDYDHSGNYGGEREAIHVEVQDAAENTLNLMTGREEWMGTLLTTVTSEFNRRNEPTRQKLLAEMRGAREGVA